MLAVDDFKAAKAVSFVDACHICGKSAWNDRAGYGFIVQDCRKCELPTCENCVESDYDCVDDPPHFVCVQWDCKDCLAKAKQEREGRNTQDYDADLQRRKSVQALVGR
jgi:hypothetical protein